MRETHDVHFDLRRHQQKPRLPIHRFAAHMDLLLKPARVATSKPAQRTYLNTLLTLIASTILLGVAIVAYWLFYFAYIPQIGISRVVHLQYGEGHHPYGIAKLDNSLISQQPYDISLMLNLPLSPPNIVQGNFMLALSLLHPSYLPPPLQATPSHLSKSPAHRNRTPATDLVPTEILHISRRPAIITYTSHLISLSSRLLALPLYILKLRSESEILHIPMFEQLSFPRGKSNVPEYIMLEILQTAADSQPVQVYDVSINFTARFGGVRWIMYNHRIISFIVFTTVFWSVEVIGLLFSWLILRSFFSSDKPDSGKRLKLEEEDSTTADLKNETDEFAEMSDTERTFPTYGRQKPLKYEGRIKSEEDEELYRIDERAVQPFGLEADDEDEDDGVGRDSGLGTSFSEGTGRGVARRRSKGKMVGGASIGN